jgi:hypothetical protein
MIGDSNPSHRAATTTGASNRATQAVGTLSESRYNRGPAMGIISTTDGDDNKVEK